MNFRKLRGKSLAELRTRGRQKITAIVEQIGLANVAPTNREFFELFDRTAFAGKPANAKVLHENFKQTAANRFFPAFQNHAQTAAIFRARFGNRAAQNIVERAQSAIAGRFDLLGFSDLNFGVPIDWHLEPISNKRAALKHWKLFDELDADETGDKKIVWELNRHQHFFTLGAAYWLTGDERFAAAFVMHLCGWIEQNPPKQGVNWISSLEVGLRAISWLWGLHFFKDSPSLSPTVFAEAIKNLYLHGQHIETYLSTFYSPNTHLTGEALALYYLGALLPELDCARRWRLKGAQILLGELDRQILPDGVYFEQSTWYARYTVDFYLHFLILSSLNREKFSAGEHEKLETKLQAALDFMLHATRPDGSAPVIGDDDGGQMLPISAAATMPASDFRPTLATAAAIFERGDYKFVSAKMDEQSFWLLGAAGLEKYDRLEAHQPAEKSRYFSNGGYYVARSDWTPRADFIIFDGGRHSFLSGGHAHADALAFELAHKGASALVDSGTFTYHESLAARNQFRRTAAHNTATVDDKSSSEPAGKFAWSKIADARFETVVPHRRFDFFVAAHAGFSETSTTTEPRPITHKRSMLFLRNDYTVIRDDFDASGQHEYQLNFHFAPDFAVADCADNSLLCSPQNSEAGKFKIAAFGDGGGWQVGEDWISECYGARERAATARFVARAAGRQEFFTFLLPADSDSNLLQTREIAADGGRVFQIDFAAQTDFLLSGDGDGFLIDGDLFRTDFRFAWARVDRAAKRLIELVLLDGKRFEINKKSVVAANQNLGFAWARRTGGELRFETDEREFCKFSAQNFDLKLHLPESE